MMIQLKDLKVDKTYVDSNGWHFVIRKVGRAGSPRKKHTNISSIVSWTDSQIFIREMTFAQKRRDWVFPVFSICDGKKYSTSPNKYKGLPYRFVGIAHATNQTGTAEECDVVLTKIEKELQEFNAWRNHQVYRIDVLDGNIKRGDPHYLTDEWEDLVKEMMEDSSLFAYKGTVAEDESQKI